MLQSCTFVSLQLTVFLDVQTSQREHCKHTVLMVNYHWRKVTFEYKASCLFLSVKQWAKGNTVVICAYPLSQNLKKTKKQLPPVKLNVTLGLYYQN